MSEFIDLNHAFPKHIEKMHRLRGEDQHFAKLYDHYLGIERELEKIAKEAETPRDDYVEERKKIRLWLKDEMLAILEHEAA